MFYLIRQIIKCWMPVYFVFSGLIKTFGIIRIASMNMFAFHYPDTNAFLAAGIYIPCIFDGHLCICGMQAACMFMIQSLFTANEHFPQWPVGAIGLCLVIAAASFFFGNITIVDFSDLETHMRSWLMIINYLLLLIIDYWFQPSWRFLNI